MYCTALADDAAGLEARIDGDGSLAFGEVCDKTSECRSGAECKALSCKNQWHGSSSGLALLSAILFLWGISFGYAMYVPPWIYVAELGQKNSVHMDLCCAVFPWRNPCSWC